MKRQISFDSRSNTSGFTLMEVIVILVLIGVLFAIAAPSWVAFINQQRVGAARNQVSQAIRSAQAEAQRTKLKRAIVFDNNNNQPRYAIVPLPDDTDAVDRDNIKNWQSLGDGTIQPGTIRLSVVLEGLPRAAEPPLLIFDAYGSVVTKPLSYTVTIGSTLSENPRRCVAVETLLGALREGSNSETSPGANDGCPPN